MRFFGLQTRWHFSLFCIVAAAVISAASWQHIAAKEQVAHREDLTDMVNVKVPSTLRKVGRDGYSVKVRITNTSEEPLLGPIFLVIQGTNVDGLTVRKADGITSDKKTVHRIRSGWEKTRAGTVYQTAEDRIRVEPPVASKRPPSVQARIQSHANDVPRLQVASYAGSAIDKSLFKREQTGIPEYKKRVERQEVGVKWQESGQENIQKTTAEFGETEQAEAQVSDTAAGQAGSPAGQTDSESLDPAADE